MIINDDPARLFTTATHIQDYDAIIELVEALPDHDQILKAPVQYQYDETALVTETRH